MIRKSTDKSLGMSIHAEALLYYLLDAKDVRRESNHFSSACIKLSMTLTAPSTPMRLLSMHRS